MSEKDFKSEFNQALRFMWWFGYWIGFLFGGSAVVLVMLCLSGCTGWRFSERNDYFTAFNKDNDYTQGIRLERARLNDTFGFGQDIYTPEHKDTREPLPGERPYAGMIYADQVYYRPLNQDSEYFYGVTGGLVGSAALGKQAQCGIHALLGQDCPAGWSSQLSNEPVFSGKTGIRIPSLTPYGFSQSFLTLEAGTLSTAIRFRTQIKREWGRFFYFAGSGANVVLRDIFLDGNTFTDSHQADKKLFNTELRGGIGWNFDSWSAEWFIAIRSPQFEAQNASYNYGGVELSWR